MRAFFDGKGSLEALWFERQHGRADMLVSRGQLIFNDEERTCRATLHCVGNELIQYDPMQVVLKQHPNGTFSFKADCYDSPDEEFELVLLKGEGEIAFMCDDEEEVVFFRPVSTG